MEAVSMNYGATQHLPENSLARPGYTFVGWSTSRTGEIVYDDRDEYTMGEKAEYVLYAQWQIKVNRIRFEANGGSGSMSYVEAEYGSLVRLPYNEFYREGYTFVGWSTTPDGKKAYGDEAEYKMGADSEYTLYALWVGSENPFIFHANGGEGNMPTDFTIATGEMKKLPANQFIRNGYVFIGWSTDEYGAVKYEECADFSKTTGGEVVLYAKWQLIDYTVSFESNGGSVVSDKSYHAETDDFYFPTPTRDGYEFAGWYDNPELTGYATDGVWRGSYGDKTYYAKWVLIEYEITYECNGGDYIDWRYYHIETPTFALPTPRRTGYTFAGWYRNSDFTGDVITDIETGSFGDIHLFAKWDLITYEIIFNANGGTDIPTRTYNVESDGFSLPEPTKAGYEFVGWYRDADFLTSWVDYVHGGSNGNMELYAKWELIEYGITYECNGGDYIDWRSYHIETPTFALPTPRRTGYTFAGWYRNSDFTGDVITDIETGSFGDIHLFAKWDLITYEIIFNANGGTDIPTRTYNVESDGFSLPEPTKAGYEFAGWYRDAAFLTSWVDYVHGGSNGDMELYAKWELIEYGITYECNGGDYIDWRSYHIETPTFALPTPVRAGYTFMGWYDNDRLEGDRVEVVPTGSIGDRGYYAKWSEPIVYSVTFDSNGGSDVTSIYYDVETYCFELPTPTKRGYHFVGWYKNNSFTGSSIRDVCGETCDDMTLYAKWVLQDYSVYHDTNGGDYISAGTYTVESGYQIPTPVRPGYQFAGWYSHYSLIGDPVTEIEAGEIGDKTFYAAWIANEYTVVYHANGGIGETSSSEHIYDIGQPLTKNGFTREYYRFDGWSLAPNGSVAYGDEEWVANLTPDSNGQVTLYAKWTPISYCIEYYTNGGNWMETRYYHVETPTFELPVPERSGYTFMGWYTSEAMAEEDKISLVKNGTAGDMVLYAQWQVNTYTVTLNANGGTVLSSSQNVVFDEAYGSLPVPDRTGYTFLGWYTASMGGTNVQEDTIVSIDHNHTLYARWAVNRYTISFVTEDGTPITSHTYGYSSATSAPDDPTRDGYDFAGWTFDCSGFEFGDLMPAQDIVATAIWTFKSVTYDSGYSKKTVDATYEYTFDSFDLSSLSVFMNADYTLRFKIQIFMAEIYAGYQEIYLCKGDQTHVAGIYAFEYGGSGDAHKSYSWVEFNWSVSGDACTDIMLLRYGAHGDKSDDWVRAQAKVVVTVEKKQA